MDVQRFEKEVRAAIEQCRANVSAFTTPQGDGRGAEPTLMAYDRMFAPLNGLSGRLHLYTQAHPDEAMRVVCEELERELSSLRTEVALNRDVYERLAAVEPEDARTPEQRRLLEHALRDFRRSGVDRSPETRAAIKALQEELVRVGQDFDRNIITGGREFVVAEGHGGLEGLPADFLASHPEREDGSVVLTTDPTDRIPFLSYAERDDLRREYFAVCMQRACPENLEVLPELLEKRHAMARLLDYPTWADYITEDKMTGSAREARAFIERVIDLVRERARAETSELLEEKRKRHPDATAVFDWERAYLVEKVRRTRFDFDSQSVRPYFAFERVKAGVLATSAQLYGVEFRRDERTECWHSSVECYEIVDRGEVVARFFLDMHPRENKFKHAAMFHLAEGLEEGVLPEAALVCNFPEPTADDPALLLHDQVTTFFHEVGHLLHHLFAGRQHFLSFSGIATEHDFVEVPSQMYEEWAWNAPVLQTFALHHETEEPIPEAMVHRLRSAQEYGKGLSVLTQMFYAMLSMTYYDRDPAALDPTETMNRLREELLPIESESEGNFHASFGHLHGYSAMYYTYMWSLVIAKDLFSRFENDLMNGATANEYRRAVLAPGGSKDAKDLVRGFLGREYAFEAFERWLQR